MVQKIACSLYGLWPPAWVTLESVQLVVVLGQFPVILADERMLQRIICFHHGQNSAGRQVLALDCRQGEPSSLPFWYGSLSMIPHAMQGTTSTVDKNSGPNASVMSQVSSGEDGVNNEEEHLILRTKCPQWGCDGAGQQR